MYSGQLDTRKSPEAGEPSSATAELDALGRLAEPQADTRAGPNANAAAAAALRPRNCLRDVGLLLVCMPKQRRNDNTHQHMSILLSQHDDHAVFNQHRS
jgi:hypothetical protein